MQQDFLLQRYADCFAAMGSEPRLRIVRLLLSCLPDGLIVGEIQTEVGMASSTLSHHLDRLKQEDLVTAVREGTAWRYRANATTLQNLLNFLMAECCARSSVDPKKVGNHARRNQSHSNGS
jgi:DNA-binding transcriptional ArsR family regulator